MKPETYTLLVASNRSGTMRKITVPFYALYLLAALAVVGGISVAVAAGSYTQLLWKASNYNALLRSQDNLRLQYQQLQRTAQDTDQRLSSLQSLASEVAMAYGFLRLHDSPFRVTGLPIESNDAFENTVAEFSFLEKNATAISLAKNSLHLIPVRGLGLGEETFTPTLWPVIGRITGHFGERLDPFSGEGVFHAGVDIASQYGDAVRAAAGGAVIEAARRAGYGRLVVVDHGFGLTTHYSHLSSFTVPVGMQVKRGDVIGYVGVSGRTTGPHVHYEVRMNNAAVNPMRYLRYSSSAD